jgi:hypothetical protein
VRARKNREAGGVLLEQGEQFSSSGRAVGARKKIEKQGDYCWRNSPTVEYIYCRTMWEQGKHIDAGGVLLEQGEQYIKAGEQCWSTWEQYRSKGTTLEEGEQYRNKGSNVSSVR